MRQIDFNTGIRDPQFRALMEIDLSEDATTKVLEDPWTLRLWYEHTARVKGFQPEPASATVTNLAPTPPIVREKVPMSGSMKWLIATPFLLVIAGFLGYHNTMAAQNPDRNNNEFAAIVACEDAVSPNLKAPSGAKFESQAVGGGPWTVTGTVDSENSFGAMIRTAYKCTVDIDGGSAKTTITAIG